MSYRSLKAIERHAMTYTCHNCICKGELKARVVRKYNGPQVQPCAGQKFPYSDIFYYRE